MMEKNFDLKDKTHEEILRGFIEVCKTGTSIDCSRYADQAKRMGITWEELCEYKRRETKERRTENDIIRHN